MIKNHIEQLKQAIKEQYGVDIEVAVKAFCCDETTAAQLASDAAKEFNLEQSQVTGNITNWHSAGVLGDEFELTAFYQDGDKDDN